MWVSKHTLTTVHGCEANHMASLTNFEWTLGNVKGTVLHKAIELGLNWRGPVVPAVVVDEALDQLAHNEGASASQFIEQLPEGDMAQLRSSAIDLYTKFDECFPTLKAAWRPVLESSARYEMFDQRINLSTRADLTLGAPGSKVIIDVKSGRLHSSHREELRFYALVEAMRTGMAPRRLADVGCGTAVLAMAGAMLWPEAVLGRIVASDIDAVAVEVAARNTEVNGLGGRIATCEAAGFDHPLIADPAPFDVILANILKGPLITLAPDLARHLAPGGRAILSGLLVGQADEVAAAYAAEGLSVIERRDIGDWATLVVGRAWAGRRARGPAGGSALAPH